LTFISTLLLTTAIAAPAFAQIEEIVVTAQKKSEDIQTVPIAVTAYTAQDLKDRQIDKFDDLQFATPNVTYSQGNFGGANFQIRGLGITAVGGGAESGVAINFSDVYLAYPPTDGSTFYDLQDLEVLRGPQSTLYGRGATGGVVNEAPNRPDLESWSTQIDAQYGNYNGYEVKGDVNMPIITDKLAARVAGDIVYHSGFTENIADGSHQNDRSQYSIRGSIRWEPTSHTTVDFVGQFGKEDDSRARADKELCNPDPTGVLGCTPGKPETGALNLNATYLNILAGKEGVGGVFGPALAFPAVQAAVTALVSPGGGLYGVPGAAAAATAELTGFLSGPGSALGTYTGAAGCTTANTACYAGGGGNIPALLAGLPTGNPINAAITATIQGYYAGNYAAGQGLGSSLGLFSTGTPFTAPANSNPSNYRKVNDDFDPTNKGEDNFMSLEIKQDLADWLTGTLVGGYDHNSYFNEQSYTNTFGPPLGAANLAVAEGTFLGFLTAEGRPDLAAAYSPYFTAVPGELPVSAFKNLGISSGSIARYSPNSSSNDQADGNSSELSAEVRFNSKFEGPVNFLLGGYFLQTHENTDYYVGSNSLDYAGILLGGVTSTLGGLPAGLIGPTYYHNEGRNIDLTSRSVYGEVYYDIVPDLLKLTGGLRYNEDTKSEDSRIGVLSGYVPVGTSNEEAALNGLLPFSAANGSFQHGKFDSTTGRLVLDYTPKLPFTDQTLFYASYSHGYKAGGFNPGIQLGAGSAGLSPTYGPEQVDAYELGTKNILLDGHLQANADVWYYNYNGLQVSQIIDNTSINANIAAKLYGVEGEFVWLATDNLQIDLNIAETHSGVVNTAEVDPRNPTGGDPRAILIKDNSLTASANQNCVIYDLNAGHASPQLPTGYTTVPSSSGPQVAQFVAPPGGTGALASSGIAAAAFGSCSPSSQLATFLANQGYSETDPSYKGSTMTGVPENLNGNQLQQTPNLTVSIGAQYTFNLNDGYTLVPRVDYYWQSHMWGRIFHDPADYEASWNVTNAQVTLNAPDKDWYVGAFIKNAFDKTYITGEYLTSSSSGLYTNAFLGDPRTYGVTAGIHF
jgi:outer membrane receptor protein involved in Fe transport